MNLNNYLKKTLFIALLWLVTGCSSNKDKFDGIWANGSDYLTIQKANSDNFAIKVQPITPTEYSSSREAVGHYESGCDCIEFAFGEKPLKIVLVKSGIFVDRLGEFQFHSKLNN